MFFNVGKSIIIDNVHEASQIAQDREAWSADKNVLCL